MNKKGIGPVVASALLLLVAVVAVVGFQSWFNTYSLTTFTNVEQNSASNFNTGIENLISGVLYIKNPNKNLSVNKVKIGNIDCEINGSYIDEIVEIDVSTCLENQNTKTPEVNIYTNSKIYSKKVFIDSVNSFVCTSKPPENFYDGNGTINNPYQICDCIQLQAINNYLDTHFKLIKDIDCTDTINWNMGSGFVPLGNGEPSFQGSFNGNNFSINNLFIYLLGSPVGLFGSAEFANISNLGLTNINITGTTNVGGLVGYNVNNSNIDNSYSSGSVNGTFYVGGLVGRNDIYSNINNSYSSGMINGIYSVGGLVGYNRYNSVIDNSYSSGLVNGTDFVGGLVGTNNVYSNINNSYSSGIVNGTNRVGGLVAYNGHNSIINNSYSSGMINGTYYVGGLVGYNYHYSNIDNSYSSGIVNGINDVGGLVGYNYYHSNIDNSYSSGSVNGTTDVGGLVGYNYYHSNIDNSYSSGSVNGTMDVGGLVGYNYYHSNIDNSYSIGSVNGTIEVGGLVGRNSDYSVIDNSYYNNKTSNPDVLFGSNFGSSIVTFSFGILDNESYFYFNTNLPLSNWNTDIWNFTGINFPTLK